MSALSRPANRALLVFIALAPCLALDIADIQPAEAARTVQVKFVDHYRHGRVKVGIDNVTRRIGYGEVKGPFAVTPDSMGNDSTYVEALRYDRCGEGDIGYYFRPGGHHYKVVVVQQGHCDLPSGKRVPAPHVEVIKID